MRHNNKNKTLGRQKGSRKSLYRNMATSLFKDESIKTTLAKAKAVRPYIEKIITKAKRGNLADIRNISSEIKNKNVISKLILDIGKRFSKRDGGYTRIIKLGNRKGDGSQMAILELVSKKEIKKEVSSSVKEDSKKEKTLSSKSKNIEESKDASKLKSKNKKEKTSENSSKKIEKKASKAEDKK
ncbi:50S ribosomal protein L17 [Patescibacteria group bacterium]|nr:50S ribosomal protein L17 [Patescibacteria group bacterium]